MPRLIFFLLGLSILLGLTIAATWAFIVFPSHRTAIASSFGVAFVLAVVITFGLARAQPAPMLGELVVAVVWLPIGLLAVVGAFAIILYPLAEYLIVPVFDSIKAELALFLNFREEDVSKFFEHWNAALSQPGDISSRLRALFVEGPEAIEHGIGLALYAAGKYWTEFPNAPYVAHLLALLVLMILVNMFETFVGELIRMGRLLRRRPAVVVSYDHSVAGEARTVSEKLAERGHPQSRTGQGACAAPEVVGEYSKEVGPGRESMQKGFGIAALVIVIVAIFVPIYGLFLTGLALILAVISALAGDRIFATATPIIACVSVFFLSPLLSRVLADAPDRRGFYVLAAVFLLAPFVAMAIHSKGVVRIGT